MDTITRDIVASIIRLAGADPAVIPMDAVTVRRAGDSVVISWSHEYELAENGTKIVNEEFHAARKPVQKAVYISAVLG